MIWITRGRRAAARWLYQQALCAPGTEADVNLYVYRGEKKSFTQCLLLWRLLMPLCWLCQTAYTKGGRGTDEAAETEEKIWQAAIRKIRLKRREGREQIQCHLVKTLAERFLQSKVYKRYVPCSFFTYFSKNT